MGFFSSAFKSITKVVKKVAKSVKKLGSNVWSGVKKGFGKVSEAFGKLGPIGTIGLSMMMPGIGSALSGFWSTTAANLSLQPGFFGALGRGMTWAAEAASTAGSFVSKGINSVTETIGNALKHVGGDIASGADKMFQGTQKFLGVKDPSSIKDVGKWIGEQAEKITGKPDPLTEAQKAQKVFEANPELRSAFNQTEQARMTEIARNPNFATAVNPPAPVTELSDLEKASKLFKAKPGAADVGLSQADINQQFTSTVAQSPQTAQQFGGQVFDATKGAAGAAKTSITGTLLSAAKGGFDFLADEDQTPTLPRISGGDIGNAGISQRLGIGGQGAAGGSLVGAVSPQLLQQLQQANQRLQQVG